MKPAKKNITKSLERAQAVAAQLPDPVELERMLSRLEKALIEFEPPCPPGRRTPLQATLDVALNAVGTIRRDTRTAKWALREAEKLLKNPGEPVSFL